MNTHRLTRRLVTRAATAAALASALGLGAVHTATASVAVASPPTGVAAPRSAPAADRPATDPDGGWHQDGLELTAADNQKVDAFVTRARQAERSISPLVRAAAELSDARLIGFDQRLKSPDSLKRKVATAMREAPGQTVDRSLATINDAVRFTLQWPADEYSTGVTTRGRAALRVGQRQHPLVQHLAPQGGLQGDQLRLARAPLRPALRGPVPHPAEQGGPAGDAQAVRGAAAARHPAGARTGTPGAAERHLRGGPRTGGRRTADRAERTPVGPGVRSRGLTPGG